MKISAVLHLVKINFKNFFREPGALFWSFAFPVGIAWVLGVAFSSSPEKSYTVLLEGAQIKEVLFPDSSSSALLKKLGTGTGVQAAVHFEEASAAVIEQRLKKGTCILYISQEEGKPVFHYDPENSEAVLLYLLLERELALGQGRVAASMAPITTKGVRYIDFLIPGLLALGIMNSCIWGISWYLIELRMKKLLRRMVATPMKKSVFMLSHFITRLFLSVFESVILLVFAWVFFDIHLNGSIGAFILVYLAGVLAFGGIGLVLASRTQSTHVGNGLINAVVMPMTIVSGIFFSYQGFPEWVLPIIKILPLTILSDSVRAIFNEGASWSEVLMPAAILAGIGLILYYIGLRIFKWY
jgi:ABC-2 type transport system permease protein